MGAVVGYAHPANKQCDIAYAKIKTGSYTGNGADDRNIDIGINLTLKNNVFAIVHATTSAYPPVCRVETGQGDLSKDFDENSEAVNYIQAVTSTGFQVGSNARVNENTKTIRYFVTWSEP